MAKMVCKWGLLSTYCTNRDGLPSTTHPKMEVVVSLERNLLTTDWRASTVVLITSLSFVSWGS